MDKRSLFVKIIAGILLAAMILPTIATLVIRIFA